MDHTKLTPDSCKCRGADLAKLVASWSKRAQSRVEQAFKDGLPVDVSAVRHEAQLVASIARGGPMAFAPENQHYGHFCPDCPYRRRTPMRSTLAVAPKAAAG